MMLKLGGAILFLRGDDSHCTPNVEDIAETCYGDRRISFQKGLSGARHDEVLWHELGHLLADRIRVLFKEGADIEFFCDRFAEFVDSLTKQNNLLTDGWSLDLRDDDTTKE